MAGELATQWHITGWDTEGCIEAVFACFESWITYHREGSTNSQDEEKILEQTRHFFESQASRFEPFDQQSNTTLARRAGFQANNGEFYVFTKTFNAEIAKGYEPRLVAQCLAKHKLLFTPTTGTKLSILQRVPAMNNKVMRLYRFPSHIIAGGETLDIENSGLQGLHGLQ